MYGKTWAAAVAAAFLMAACAPQMEASLSGKMSDETTAGGGAASQSDSYTAAASPAFSADAAASDERSQGLMGTRVIYFEFDKSVVSEDQLPVIDAHADYLSRNPGQGVVLEGNADERGSNEYNLALGQRRAEAVREIMSAAGVSGAQVEAISFGEENPRRLGSSEDAWAENRRVEIRYRGE